MKRKLSLILNVFLITGIYAQQQVSSFTYDDIRETNPYGFIEYNDIMYFNASSDGYGGEIWYSDGSNQSTAILKDIKSGNEDGVTFSLNQSSTILNDALYFIASDDNSGGEIWKTDGTSSGTSQVTDFVKGRVSQLTSVGNNIFFLIKPDDYHLQVWKSDGTTDGTVLVRDGISIWNTPTFQGECNDIFIFTFREYGANDSRVWRSDGTTEGTYPLTEELDGNGSGPGGTSALTQYIQYNNKLYFVSRSFLHETDGTLENTKTISRLWQASTNLVEYSDVIELNNKLYFLFFSDDNFQLSIWESDGTEAGTNEIYYIDNEQYFSPSNFATTSDALIFCSTNETGGTSLVSLNLNSYEISNLTELADIEEPSLFGSWDACKIFTISSDEFFIYLPYSSQKRAFITNLVTNTTEYHSSLDNLWNVFVYNQQLFYSKDYQLWKYTDGVNNVLELNQESLMLYPNPATDYISLSASNKIESIKIFDINGKLIIRMSNIDNNRININNLKQGTYIVECILNEHYFTKKLIKE